MSDHEEEQPQEKPFFVDRAKFGRASCKKCKQKIDQGALRFAKIGHNPYGSGTMKMWHHIPCIFEVFKKQRPTTKKIESPDDIGGWMDISKEDRDEIVEYFSPELKQVFEEWKSTDNDYQKSKAPVKQSKENKSDTNSENENHKDNSFRAFRKICVKLTEESSYNIKTSIIKEFFTHGSDGKTFKGDIALWCTLLLPGVVKKVYNLQSKQLIKIFSRIFGTDQDAMLEDFEKGDVAETIATFFETSKNQKPNNKSTLSLKAVDNFLEALSSMTKEEEQMNHFTKILKQCTSNDLKIIIRLIKHDLRINAGAKLVLDALHPDAYKAFQASRDLKSVIENALKTGNSENKSKSSNKGMDIDLKLMTPVLPMLAQACSSVEMALKKCQNGMFSEIKYDGERVQLHKEGNTFKYFSRSLKPVMHHKVNHFKDYIPEAFPHGKDLILDAEILMVDNATGKPLPFGTLGIHKKSEFKDANVCLFVFDCIYYNGESLLNMPLRGRKEILKKHMVEIKNHIMFSEMEEIHDGEDLEAMMTKVFKLGLEGLVLKDIESIYEPGKRHWLKVKKDYLFEGAMADSADLVVLGAWFGTGNKGGIMSIFLMGCYDEDKKKWRTVTKVHGGHDDSTLEKLQSELKMVKISKDPNKVPSWLKCTKTMIPDFVAKDPFKMPVWEITGAEFTQNQVHTADGISIRFPRVSKIRTDKDWKSATSFSELKKLYKASKNTENFSLKTVKSTKNEASNGEDSAEEEKKEDSVSHKKRKKRSAEQDDDVHRSKKPKLKNGGGDHDIETEANTDTEEGSGANMKAIDEDENDTDTDVDMESEESSAIDWENIKKRLPDIFVNCVIQIPTNYNEVEYLRRCLIAFGAVLYNENEKSFLENSKHKVTHVVHVKKKSAITKEGHWAENVRHVHVDWVWDSVLRLGRQSERKYAITCI